MSFGGELRHVGVVVVGHRDCVTGRHGDVELAFRCESGHHFDEPGLLVVDLVAVHIDGNTVLFGEVEDYPQRGHAVFGRALIVRDAANNVGSHLECLLEKLGPVAERQDGVLREGDNLDLDPVLDVLAQLKDGFQRRQLWIGDVNV